MMKQLKLAVVLTATLGAGAALSLPAQAAPARMSGELGNLAAQLNPIQKTAVFVYAGREFCFYPDGWHGPGWYWCGYSWRRGFGWGGPEGWHGWYREGRRGGVGVHAGTRFQERGFVERSTGGREFRERHGAVGRSFEGRNAAIGGNARVKGNARMGGTAETGGPGHHAGMAGGKGQGHLMGQVGGGGGAPGGAGIRAQGGAGLGGHGAGAHGAGGAGGKAHQ